jgi:hypothetical protein
MTLCQEQSGEVERALNRTEAAAALGISVRYFFDIRKKFETDFAVCEWRGRRPVFYRAHIEGLREAMTWTTKAPKPPSHGHRSGRKTTTSATFTSAEDAYESALAYAT